MILFDKGLETISYPFKTPILLTSNGLQGKDRILIYKIIKKEGTYHFDCRLNIRDSGSNEIVPYLTDCYNQAALTVDNPTLAINSIGSFVAILEAEDPSTVTLLGEPSSQPINVPDDQAGLKECSVEQAIPEPTCLQGIDGKLSISGVLYYTIDEVLKKVDITVVESSSSEYEAGDKLTLEQYEGLTEVACNDMPRCNKGYSRV